MRKPLVVALAVAGLMFASANCFALRALPIRVQPQASRQVATSEVVVIGKVESLQDKTVKAKHYQSGVTEDLEYQVATVKIEDGLLGVKGLTHIQVAYPVVGAPGGGVGGGVDGGGGFARPPIRRGGVLPLTLTKDQEGCFFLVKHPTETFYVAINSFDFMDKTNPLFEKYAAVTKKCAIVLEDPEKGLKSKDAAERLLAANILLTRYRSPKFGGNKQEPIEAEQSKAILEAIAEADWAKPDNETQTNAQNMFYLLGVTPADGWTQPTDFAQLPDAAKKWLKENAGTFRVKRLVFEAPK
jgi:hypothetical protein